MKNKGGRGKKADYSTVVMRIPAPLKAEVDKLIEKFYADNVNKPVTSIQAVDVNKAVTSIETVDVNKAVTGIKVATVDKAVTGIETLNLPKVTYLALKKYRINTIEELANAYEKGHLKNAMGISKASLKAIKDALSKI